MKLVIVESPAKAKTIENILGKGYKVVSSFGHVRDLAKDGDKNTGIQIAKKYKPHYEVPEEKKKVVAELKKLAKKSSEVILATDEDREGEAISWHLSEVLGLDQRKTSRIVFTEITPEAISEAVKNPRKIDSHLVDAQQARRILDRLVGFELSGLLWKKVRGKLSAGRVQSVAVKLIVEKEREIKNFKPENYFKITGLFSPKKGSTSDEFKAELSDTLKSKDDAKNFLETCKKAKFTVKAVAVKPHKKSPRPPFTTSTLQQAASHVLGFSVSRTMQNAQRLYEAGHITYMRTDSTNLSNTAIKQMAGFIKGKYGEKYIQTRQYAKKSKNAQEAHEAIRPTYVNKDKVTSNRDQQKLYDLIRRRAVASQMASAEVERTTVTIDVEHSNKNFIAKGEIIIFDGYLKLYKKASEDVFLPKLEEGKPVYSNSIEALERMTKPPARYSEATLVKKLEELGIGRPSTYAPTIGKITSPSRGYITKESTEGDPIEYQTLSLKGSKITESIKEEITGAQKNKLFAHEIGALVTDFLDDHFEKIMSYNFTAQVEDKLDDIAVGDAKWVEVIDDYYKPFHKRVESTLDKAERVTGERILGKDPKTKKTVLVRMSKYGPVAQIGAPDELKEDEKPTYANLRKGQELSEITLDEALTLFELPKDLGKYKDFDVSVGIGRYGPYVKYDDKYVSIPKGIDPYEITMTQAQTLIRDKEKENEPIGHYKDLPITKGKGRFGPYVKWNGLYASISKKSGYKLETINEAEAIDLIRTKEKKEKERIIQQWDGEKISIEKGRWGPFIKLKGSRKFFRLPLNKDGKKMTVEQAKKVTLETAKKAVKDQGGKV